MATLRADVLQNAQNALDALQVRDNTTRALRSILKEKMEEVHQEPYPAPAVMLIHELIPYIDLAGEVQPSTMRQVARRARQLYSMVIQDARGWSGGADRELDRQIAEARREVAERAARPSSDEDEDAQYRLVLQLKELAREVSVRMDVPPRTDARVQALATMLMSLYQNRDIPSTAFQLFASAVAAHIFLGAERDPSLEPTAERAMSLYKAFLRAQGLSASAIDQTFLQDIQKYRRDLDEELARRAPVPPQEEPAAVAMDTDETLYEGDILLRIKEVAMEVVHRWRASPQLAEARANLVALAEDDVEDVPGQAYARDVTLMTMLAEHDDPDLYVFGDRAEDMYRAVLRLRGVPEQRIEDMITTEMNETYNDYIGAYESSSSEEDEEDEEDEGNDWYLQDRERHLNWSVGRTDVPTLRATQPVAMRAVPDRTLDSMAPLLGDRPHGISAGQTYFMCTNPVPHYYDATKYDEYCQGTVTTEVTPGMQGKGCLLCPYCRTLMDTQLYQVPVRRSERLVSRR